MSHHAVDSSVIATLDYAVEHAHLDVTFHSGRVYRYFLVPRSAFDALMAAESIGRHFNEHVRGRYRFEEITDHYPRHIK